MWSADFSLSVSLEIVSSGNDFPMAIADLLVASRLILRLRQLTPIPHDTAVKIHFGAIIFQTHKTGSAFHGVVACAARRRHRAILSRRTGGSVVAAVNPREIPGRCRHNHRGFSPGDVNRIRRHPDVNFTLIDQPLMRWRQSRVSCCSLALAALDFVSGTAGEQDQGKNRQHNTTRLHLRSFYRE